MTNARVVRAAKLVDGISLEQEDKEYNPSEVLADSDDSDVSVSSDKEGLPTQSSTKTPVVVIHQTIENVDTIDKLCTPCVGSKSTWVVRRNQSMTTTTNKLEEVHADLWGPHDLPLQSKSTYVAILMCKYT